VGSAAQTKATKQVAGTMKLDLAQFRELEAFSQFSSDLDDKTKAILERGQRVNDVLKQGWDTPLKMEEQVVVVFAAVKGHLDPIRVEALREWETRYLQYVHSSGAAILESIKTEQKILPETEEKLTALLKTFTELNQDLHLTAAK